MMCSVATSWLTFLVMQWSAAHQASLSFTIFRSLLKFMAIESVMPSSHLIFCCPLLLLPSIFPSIRVFSMSWLFALGSQSIRASASASVLPMNIQSWFPLGLTGLISMPTKELSSLHQHDSLKASILHRSAFFMGQLSHLYMTTGKTITLTIQTFVGKLVRLHVVMAL